MGVDFGSTTALSDVDLDIHEGEVVGLIGANGAGKSTVIGLLHGAVLPTRGRVHLFGSDPRDPRSRMRLGTTPQSVALPETLRVDELIRLVGAHFRDQAPRDEIVRDFGIEPFLRTRAGALSGGQQRAVAVALAFLGSPRLVLLDEPTAGLDLVVRRRLREAIARRAAGGCTVLLTSHYFEDIEDLATRIVVLAAGRVTADGSLAEMRRGGREVEISFATDDPSAFVGVTPADASRIIGRRLHLTTDDPDELLRSVYAVGSRVDDLEVRRVSLEDALLSLPRHADPEGSGR
ncbi:ABC transporter ATP-binding protein [Clavibacter sepedonicus]|uniref:ABC transporter ATP-binding protein n=1 Tax=Clavibacter sepedonicus TaxID=31964 RepID=B0RCU9_CLASE|nr:MULTISPECIES: ABC transporter ATP-binding protein [Clavibacter]UUK65555.1 ABC transporter ATP-binding protein [Clavibacter sepedonicus]CAQ03040.1 putative ABC transporter ATP-binding protein [Clavibacter sepedonicus]